MNDLSVLKRRMLGFYRHSEPYRRSLLQKDRDYFWEVLRAASGLWPRGALLLDAGCGVGTSTALLREEGFRAWGTDIALPPGTAPSRRWQVVSDLAGLPFLRSTFEGVVCYEVLEHLPDPEKVLSELYLSLKPGGKLLVSVPNAFGMMQLAARYRWMRGQGRSFRVRSLVREGWHNLRELVRRRTSREFNPLVREPKLDSAWEGADDDRTYYSSPREVISLGRRLGADTRSLVYFRYQGLKKWMVRAIGDLGPGRWVIWIKPPGIAS